MLKSRMKGSEQFLFRSFCYKEVKLGKDVKPW